MIRTELLRPLNDIAYLCECGCLDYTGELKAELEILCKNIRDRAPGYEAGEIQAALPELERALECYLARRSSTGASLLSAVSRAWWTAVGL